MDKVLRKHSAKCMRLRMHDGDIRHYVLIGGKAAYNGRLFLQLDSEDMAEPDGFWRESVVKIVKNSLHSSVEGLVEFISSHYNDKIKLKPEFYMREWTTVEYKGSPF